MLKTQCVLLCTFSYLFLCSFSCFDFLIINAIFVSVVLSHSARKTLDSFRSWFQVESFRFHGFLLWQGLIFSQVYQREIRKLFITFFILLFSFPYFIFFIFAFLLFLFSYTFFFLKMYMISVFFFPFLQRFKSHAD